jgi:hypothetical protein
VAAVTAIVPRTTGAAGTAFESRAGRASAVWTTVWAAIGTAATAVWAATAAAIASATLWALETGARIAADAGGIARKVFARSGSAADTGGARLTGKQNDIVFDPSRLSGDVAGMRFDHFPCGMFEFDMLFLCGVFGHGMLGITEGGSVFGAFVCGVGCEFGAIGGAMLFDFFRFILGELGFRGGLIIRSVKVGFFLALLFFGFFVVREFGFSGGVNFLGIIVEFSAADEGIGFGVSGSLFVFCFGQLQREGGRLLFA